MAPVADDTSIARAQRAARRLPRAAAPKGLDGDRASVLLALVTVVACAAGALVTTAVVAEWWALVVGAVSWLALRTGFGALRGAESATVAVDRQGTVRVLGGLGGVRRLQRAFEPGAAQRYRRTVAGAAAGAGLLLVGGGVALGLFAGQDLAAALTLSPIGWACVDLLRWFARVVLRVRRDDLELLDGARMLPLLAAYAREHGVAAVAAGVPADALPSGAARSG